MTVTKHTFDVKDNDFLPAVQSFRDLGYRLVQVGCVKEESGLGLHYTFDKEYSLVDFYLAVPSEASVPSITVHFPYAFLYENEIHDLFGVSFDNINIDFKGQFYNLAAPAPFNRKTEEHPRGKKA